MSSRSRELQTTQNSKRENNKAGLLLRRAGLMCVFIYFFIPKSYVTLETKWFPVTWLCFSGRNNSWHALKRLIFIIYFSDLCPRNVNSEKKKLRSTFFAHRCVNSNTADNFVVGHVNPTADCIQVYLSSRNGIVPHAIAYDSNRNIKFLGYACP